MTEAEAGGLPSSKDKALSEEYVVDSGEENDVSSVDNKKPPRKRMQDFFGAVPGKSKKHRPGDAPLSGAASSEDDSGLGDGLTGGTGENCQTAEDWKLTLSQSWYEALKKELRAPYFVECLKQVQDARKKKTVYPPPELVFNAFKTTPLEQVRVVIVGQDPYHGPGQAMGLCFAVNRGVKVPPSLVNIYKELGLTKCTHGDLTSWARQGVFLINALMTVEQSSPMAHKKLGWAKFTDNVIQTINDQKSKVVFMLWGKPAQLKGKNVDRTKHCVLEAGHPSPLSIKHFAGCNHFEKCNEYLKANGSTPIDWTALFA